MDQRSVKVSLFLAASQYVQGQLEAARATNKTRDAAAQAAAKLQAQKEVMETTGRSAVFFGTLVAAGIAVAVAKYAEFDQAMSNVIATGDDAKENQDELRQAALDAGAATVFSATEAANAIEELSKAGVSAKEVLSGGLKGALSLAAAGGLGVADAAGIAATTMNQFNLRGRDMSHVADLLAAGAGKAQGEVGDLSGALNQSGLVANQFGLSVDETVGTLTAFANAGLLGSDAGTSFRTMLLRLANPTGEAADTMKALGINAYDASGQFVGMSRLAGQLQKGLGGLTQEQKNAALAIIFGQDAIRGANVLLDEGANGISKWTDEVNDQGYAAEVARTKLDNLKGDLEALGGAMDTALIQSGSAANNTLRSMVQILTELVNGYSDLPEPIQGTVLAVGGVTAAVALAGGTALIAVPKFAQFKTALDLSGISMGRAALTAGAAGLALGGLFAIIGQLVQAQAEARAKAEAYADTLAEGTNRITKSTRDMVKENLAAQSSWLWLKEDSAYDAAEKLGISLDLVTEAALGNVDAMRQVEAATKVSSTSRQLAASDYAKSANIVRDAVKGENGSIEDAIRVAEQKQKADEESADSSTTAAKAYQAAADKVTSLDDALKSLVDTINKSNDVGQDAISANIAYQDQLAKVDEQIKKAREGQDGYALTLDQTTQAGRDNLGLLNDMANRAQDAANKQLELDHNTDNYRATLEASRQALIDRAQQLGYSADQATALADQILRIPSSTEWKVIADTAEAAASLDNFMSRYGVLSGRIIYRSNLPDLNGEVSGSGRFGTFAAGGPVRGPGTATSDSIPAWLSNGEYVLTAADVARMGGFSAVDAFRTGLGRAPRYADGGAVGQPRYASDRYAPVGSGQRRPVTLNVKVYPPNMDAEAMADYVVRKVERRLG